MVDTNGAVFGATVLLAEKARVVRADNCNRINIVNSNIRTSWLLLVLLLLFAVRDSIVMVHKRTRELMRVDV